MTPIITKFSPSTGDIEIMIPIPYADPWEAHINYPNIVYEEKETYNIFDLIRKNEELEQENQALKKSINKAIEIIKNDRNYDDNDFEGGIFQKDILNALEGQL